MWKLNRGIASNAFLAPVLARLLAGLAVLAVTCAQAQGGRTLQALDFVALQGERVLVTLTLSEAAPEPVVFTIDQPARLSLDLPDTRSALTTRLRKVGIGRVQAIASVEAKGRTRVVLELTASTPYSVRVEGNKVYVQVEGSSFSTSAPPPPPVSEPVAARAPPAAPAATIGNIDFRRGEKGEGRIVISLADPKTAVDVTEVGGKVYARIKNGPPPERLIRRLDVLDFATPVKYVDTERAGNDTQITVTPIEGAEFEQVAYQTGNLFTLELQPVSQEQLEERKRKNPQFTGERISLSFQNVDVRSLLQIVADVAGVNMVVSDSVNGEIAMRLQNVPWDQALDIILRTKGLGMRQQGNVILVAPLEELATREKVELETEKQKVELSPLRTELIQVNYAKASDIAKLMKGGGVAGGGGGNASGAILSARGSVSVDDRTNTLIVLETREKLAEIRALVGQLDIPVRQVLIESRVVIASDNFSRELGARFGVTSAGSLGRTGLVTTSGTPGTGGQGGGGGGAGGGAQSTATNRLGSANGTGASTMADQFLAQGRQGPVAVPSVGDRFNVNLPNPAANAAGIALAILGSSFLVDLEINALQTEGKGELLSNPRVITANGKQANVEQGVEIGYREASSSGAATVSFKKAVLSLTVTPQITPDNRILMDLGVTNDTPGAFFDNVPSIDTRRVNTQVLVKSGETVVLGGVFEQTAQKNASKVPLFGDIPVLGHFFRNDTRIDNKRELLIFVTPKLLQDGIQVK